MEKPAKTIQEQIQLLQDRGLQFSNITDAPYFLANISYYRLKGYWWEMQADKENHKFVANSYFEDIIDYYNFDRHFRLIIFNAIERIEIALRTKLIYHMSLAYGSHWHYNARLFQKVHHHNKFIHKIKMVLPLFLFLLEALTCHKSLLEPLYLLRYTGYFLDRQKQNP